MTSQSGIKHRARTPPRHSTGGGRLPPSIPHGAHNTQQDHDPRRLQQRATKLKQSDSRIPSFSSIGDNNRAGNGQQHRIRHPTQNAYSSQHHNSNKLKYGSIGVLLVTIAIIFFGAGKQMKRHSDLFPLRQGENIIRVFSHEEEEWNETTQRRYNFMYAMTSGDNIEFRVYSKEEQRSFLNQHGLLCYQPTRNEGEVDNFILE
eukprot:2027127-Ditylum_brightwellii.AAC.1